MSGKKILANLSVLTVVIVMCFYDYSLAIAMGGHKRIVGDNIVRSAPDTDTVDEMIATVDPDVISQQNEEQIALASIKLVDPVKKKDGLIVNERKRFNVDSEEKRILYRIVEAEAGGEDLSGRILVANVVINRVLNKEFPDSVKGVVFSHSGGTYQFSPIKDGRYYRVSISSLTKKAVNKAIAGFDNSSGAIYFLCRSLANPSNASWFDRELKYLFRHGCHEFFS